MPRKPTRQIHAHTDRNGVVSCSERFRGRGSAAETIRLGPSDEGMNRAWMQRRHQSRNRENARDLGRELGL